MSTASGTIEELRVELQVDIALVMERALEKAQSLSGFEEDLAYLLKIGVSEGAIGRTLGVSRVAVHYWKRGSRRPEYPLYILMVKEWAQAIRENRSQGSQGRRVAV